MIQRKAARFVFNDYSRHSSVTVMLNELDWKSLEKQRDDSILIMFPKIINQYVGIPYDHILHKSQAPPIVAAGNTYIYPQELIPTCNHFFLEQFDYGITYLITLWKLIMLILLLL